MQGSTLFSALYKTEKAPHEVKPLISLSRADWIRTSDPYVPNVVRYRAALLPEKHSNYENKKSLTKKNRALRFMRLNLFVAYQFG